MEDGTGFTATAVSFGRILLRLQFVLAGLEAVACLLSFCLPHFSLSNGHSILCHCVDHSLKTAHFSRRSPALQCEFLSGLFKIPPILFV